MGSNVSNVRARPEGFKCREAAGFWSVLMLIYGGASERAHTCYEETSATLVVASEEGGWSAGSEC